MTLMAWASSSSEVMMVAAAPQQGAAMSEAWKYGVRGSSRRNGFPAWMPAGYCAPAWNFRAATRVRKSDTSSRERPRFRLKASIRRSPTAPQSSATNGRWRRGPASWSASAMSSLPVPFSPLMHTLASPSATFVITA